MTQRSVPERGEDSQFSTTDLCTAAYLTAEGHRPELEQVDDRQVLFRFKRTEKLNEALDAFRDGSARVYPVTYHRSMVDLRDGITRTLRGGRNRE